MFSQNSKKNTQRASGKDSNNVSFLTKNCENSLSTNFRNILFGFGITLENITNLLVNFERGFFDKIGEKIAQNFVRFQGNSSENFVKSQY